MSKKRVTGLVAGALLLLVTAAPALAGGWALVVLDRVPTEVRAGEGITIGFRVLQHGVTPQSDADPQLRAFHPASGERIQAQGTQTGDVGHFEITVSFPREGTWEWEIIPEPFAGTEFAPINVLSAVRSPSTDPNPVPFAAPLQLPLRLAGVLFLLLSAGLVLYQKRATLEAAGKSA